mmetsp:Transcript_5416/g.12394  ORF Transcript_5416/g.12394 Transcript_5416/m.12394 type:complete len:256 (+) Transcript_5416:849-1616(+)
MALRVEPQRAVVGVGVDAELLKRGSVSVGTVLQKLEAQHLDERVAVLRREANGELEATASEAEVEHRGHGVEHQAGPLAPHFAGFWDFFQRLEEHLELVVIRDHELDQHSPQPSGTSVQIECLPCSQHALNHVVGPHLEQHGLQKHFPLGPRLSASALQHKARILDVACELVHTSHLEQDHAASLPWHVHQGALQQAAGSRNIPSPEFSSRAADPHFPPQVLRTVQHALHVGRAAGLQVPSAVLSLRSLEEQLPD